MRMYNTNQRGRLLSVSLGDPSEIGMWQPLSQHDIGTIVVRIGAILNQDSIRLMTPKSIENKDCILHHCLLPLIFKPNFNLIC